MEITERHMDIMILTYKVKHDRDFSREMRMAKKVAAFAIMTGSIDVIRN